jgi:hypothetical protein
MQEAGLELGTGRARGWIRAWNARECTRRSRRTGHVAADLQTPGSTAVDVPRPAIRPERDDVRQHGRLGAAAFGLGR